MRRPLLGTSAVVLAAAALLCWLFSYSWLLGGLVPMDGLVELPVSPWLLGELAAIPLGFAAVLLAVLALVPRTGFRRPLVVAAAWVGGISAVLSLLSVTAA